MSEELFEDAPVEEQLGVILAEAKGIDISNPSTYERFVELQDHEDQAKKLLKEVRKLKKNQKQIAPSKSTSELIQEANVDIFLGRYK